MYVISLIEPKKVNDALDDADWIRVMQDELHEFQRHSVWTLVPRLPGKMFVGTHCVLHNKMDEDGIIT